MTASPKALQDSSRQFKVRTFHAQSGALAELIVEGESADVITRLLQEKGQTVLSIVARHSRGLVKKRPAFNIVLFCEELRTLLSSGMTLVEAMDTLCSKEDNLILLEIKQRLMEGKAFSAALALNRFPFPPLLMASIKASERTSGIDSALDEYIVYEKLGQELGRKIVSAAIYPALVVGFGMLVSLFMIAYVVPRFAKVYEDFAQSLSLSTIILMKVGQFAGNHVGFLMGAVALLAVAGVASYRSGKLKVMLLRILGAFKITHYYLRLYQLARIYQTMSMLLRGGYTLSDAIPLAQNLAFDPSLQGQIVTAHRAVMEGKRLSTAFADNGLTDNVSARLLQVGERSGDLAKIMDIIAQTYRQEFTLFIERATRLVEPLLLMAVGLMIGAIIILMYMPVFDLAGGVT